MLLYCVAALLCMLGLVAGQSFTSDPANATKTAGERLNVTCDSGSPGAQPIVSGTKGVTAQSVVINDNVIVFQTSILTRQNNGSVLTCENPLDSSTVGTITLNVQFQPLISGVMNITVNEGESVTLNVTVDANPRASLRVTPNLPVTSVDADTVSITISNIVRDDARQYTVTATNSIGMDTATFQLAVIFIESSVPTTKSSTASVTVGQTTDSVAPVTTTTMAVSSTSSVSSTPTPTGQMTTGSATSTFGSFIVVLIFMFAGFFLIN